MPASLCAAALSRRPPTITARQARLAGVDRLQKATPSCPARPNLCFFPPPPPPVAALTPSCRATDGRPPRLDQGPTAAARGKAGQIQSERDLARDGERPVQRLKA